MKITKVTKTYEEITLTELQEMKDENEKFLLNEIQKMKEEIITELKKQYLIY